MADAVANFGGLPLGYMPAVIIAVVAIVCLVGWCIAQRQFKDRD